MERGGGGARLKDDHGTSVKSFLSTFFSCLRLQASWQLVGGWGLQQAN